MNTFLSVPYYSQDLLWSLHIPIFTQHTAHCIQQDPWITSTGHYLCTEDKINYSIEEEMINLDDMT